MMVMKMDQRGHFRAMVGQWRYRCQSIYGRSGLRRKIKTSSLTDHGASCGAACYSTGRGRRSDARLLAEVRVSEYQPTATIGTASYQPMLMVFDGFAQILSTLWAHKLRSLLTMFGIAWGVGSLLLLVGLGEGFRTG